MTKTPADLNNAILDSAKHCVNAEDPVACANQFGLRLALGQKWDAEDIEYVVKSALGVIVKLTGSTDLDSKASAKASDNRAAKLPSFISLPVL